MMYQENVSIHNLRTKNIEGSKKNKDSEKSRKQFQRQYQSKPNTIDYGAHQ